SLHAVWFTAAGGTPVVRYGRIEPGGVTAARTVGNRLAAHADVAASGDAVAVAWKAFEGGRWHLRGMISRDGGSTWREVELATVSGATDRPRVLAWRGGFHVFWNTVEAPLMVVRFP